MACKFRNSLLAVITSLPEPERIIWDFSLQPSQKSRRGQGQANPNRFIHLPYTTLQIASFSQIKAQRTHQMTILLMQYLFKMNRNQE